MLCCLHGLFGYWLLCGCLLFIIVWVVWRVAVSLFDLLEFVLWVFDADVNSVVVLCDVFSFGVWGFVYLIVLFSC